MIDFPLYWYTGTAGRETRMIEAESKVLAGPEVHLGVLIGASNHAK